MNINVNFEKKTGKIKAMHAVGQPPFLGMDMKYFKYLTEANIPYSRLHDTGGMFGRGIFVDIPNIFRNFSADETKEENYDFAFTDLIIGKLIEAKCEPIFRLGVTIENYPYIKIYRINPPEDFGKWARICEHIVRHYNEGWANGFEYGIKYWEIWNEPDSYLLDNNGGHFSMMWTGTAAQYYELYGTSAKHLKNCFGNSIKVGGYASCGFYAVLQDKPREDFDYFIKFFEDFLAYIKKENVPMDFYSYHSYESPENTAKMADYCDKTLEKFGYGDVETHINEWNTAFEFDNRGTSFASASAAAMMLIFQNRKTDVLCYYDARLGISQYGGLFNPETLTPYCTYYAFKAFGVLYRLGQQTECLVDGEQVYAVAAEKDGEKAVMITNTSGKAQNISLNVDKSFKVYLINRENHMTETDMNACDFTLENNDTVLILNK